MNKDRVFAGLYSRVPVLLLRALSVDDAQQKLDARPYQTPYVAREATQEEVRYWNEVHEELEPEDAEKLEIMANAEPPRTFDDLEIAMKVQKLVTLLLSQATINLEANLRLSQAVREGFLGNATAGMEKLGEFLQIEDQLRNALTEMLDFVKELSALTG